MQENSELGLKETVIIFAFKLLPLGWTISAQIIKNKA